MPLEPMMGDPLGRGSGSHEMASRVAVDGHPLVGKELADECVADQLVSEAVPGLVHDEDPRRQRQVE